MTDMQKMSSRVNIFFSMALLVFNTFYFVEQGERAIIFWIVFSGVTFLLDLLLGMPLFSNRSHVWIGLRIFELLMYAVAFNLERYNAGLALNSLAMLLLLFQLVFSFDYGDIYTRVITTILGVLPAAVVLIINMLLTTMETREIFERTGILACLTALCAVLSSMAVLEMNKIEQKLFEQRRLVDNTKEINEELKQHQEKVKRANAELGVQKIKLETAYNRINSANTEMILQNGILKAMASVIEAEKLLSIMTASLKDELKLNCCAILLKKDAVLNEEPLCSIQSIFSADGEEMLCTAIKENVMDDYLAHRGGYVDNHVRADSYRFLDDRSAGSLLILPIEKEEQIIGGLLAIHTRYDFFTENRMFFDTIMAQFIIALNNAGLYAKMQHMAVCDGLTGIYNRGHLNLKMDQFIRTAEEEKTPLSIALFDIDHFKRVNDTYGHLFGDLVIKTIAGFASEMAKKYRGFAARYGGEEFVLAFPGKDVETCCEIVEEMRSNVHSMKLDYDGVYVSVNVSVGVTGYPQCCEKASVLLEHADWAMYYSKKHGRDQVTVDSAEIRGQLGLTEV